MPLALKEAVVLSSLEEAFLRSGYLSQCSPSFQPVLPCKIGLEGVSKLATENPK